MILVQGTITSLLLALSIQIPLRMGVFSFAGIGFYGIGAYTSAIVTIRYGWPSYLAIIAGMLLAAVGRASCSGSSSQRLNGLYLGMATIAFVLILSVAVVNFGSLTGGASGLYGAIASIQMYTRRAHRRRHHRVDRVHRARPDRAPDRGSARGSAAGHVDGHQRQAPAAALLRRQRSARRARPAGSTPCCARPSRPTTSASRVVVTALTMIIVGGARSWLGAVIGAIIFTWLPNVLTVVGPMAGRRSTGSSSRSPRCGCPAGWSG